MNTNKTYSKKEISKILNKASEIQTQKDLYGDKDGLNEEELLAIAQEVGIDQDSLLQAIESLDNPKNNSSFNWISGSSNLQNISFTNGEINQEMWDDVVQEIRKINGGIGKTTQNGSSFEWEQRMREIGYKHFSFTPKDGKTKIQFVSGWNGLKMISTFLPSFFGFIFALLFLEGLGMTKDISIMFAPIGGVLGFGIGRVFLKNYFEKQKMLMSSIQKSVARVIQKNSSGIERITLEEDAYNSIDESKVPSSKAHS